MKDVSEFLSIKSKTWIRDSHGLFDYESDTVMENYLIIEYPTTIVRRGDEIKDIKSNDSNQNDQVMCNVKVKGGSK